MSIIKYIIAAAVDGQQVVGEEGMEDRSPRLSRSGAKVLPRWIAGGGVFFSGKINVALPFNAQS